MPTGEKSDACDLCEAAKITHWFHEDDVCWIAECEICDTPMVVWRWHGIDPTRARARPHAHRAGPGVGDRLRRRTTSTTTCATSPTTTTPTPAPGGFFGHGHRRDK